MAVDPGKLMLKIVAVCARAIKLFLTRIPNYSLYHFLMGFWFEAATT
jgi:hypothetical protein